MRRASLNLSVNAIVVFVLAFAMLGVGLSFTSMIRNKIDDSMGQLTTVQDFNNPPTASNPLTLNDEIVVKRGDKEKIQVGFYNKGSTAYNVSIGIRKCIDNNGDPMDNVPKAVSIHAEEIPPSETQGFMFTLDMGQNQDGYDLDYNAGTYTCEFIAFDKTRIMDESIKDITQIEEDEIYEQKQFWLEVTP